MEILVGPGKGAKDMFNRYKLNKRKGITLVELVIIVAIVGIVFSLAGSMLVFSIKSHKIVEEEFQIQSSIRLSSQVISSYIRDSSAIFMLNDAQFNNSNLKDEWDYFALSSDKKQVVQYKWDAVSKTHITNVLADSYPGIIYSLSFDKSTADSLLSGFSIKAVNSSGNVKVGIDNELNAINSVVVDNTGNVGYPAVALAYRTEDIPDPSKPRISVTLVLDKSGSMAWNLQGNTITNGYSNPNSRLSIMRARTLDLINELERIGNVHVAVIRFDTNANKSGNYHNLYNIDTNKTAIVDLVNGINVAEGGTNIGDAMRRAYYIHDGFKNSNTGNMLHYNIQLMDGNPTYWSRYTSGSSTNYFYNDGDIGSSTSTSTGGTGQEDAANMNNSMLYVEKIGDNLYKLGNVGIKTFVIGFSANSSNINRLSSIAGYVTSSTNSSIVGQYYEASSSDALAEVYRDISRKIELDAWHIFGPNN